MKNMYKCAECEKRFIMIAGPEEWVYKIVWPYGARKYYCSWSCFRKAQKKKQRRKTENLRAAGQHRAEMRRKAGA